MTNNLKRGVSLFTLCLYMVTAFTLPPFVLPAAQQVFAAGNAAGFAAGDGTEGNPYQVSTPEHLDAVRNYPDAYFI